MLSECLALQSCDHSWKKGSEIPKPCPGRVKPHFLSLDLHKTLCTQCRDELLRLRPSSSGKTREKGAPQCPG